MSPFTEALISALDEMIAENPEADPVELLAELAGIWSLLGPPAAALHHAREGAEAWAAQASEYEIVTMAWATTRRLPLERQRGLVVALMREAALAA